MEPSQIQQAWAERGFSCTVSTDPYGQVWANFIHEVDGLVTLVEGEIELSFQGQTLRPRIGEEVFIPAGRVTRFAILVLRPIAGVSAISTKTRQTIQEQEQDPHRGLPVPAEDRPV